MNTTLLLVLVLLTILAGLVVAILFVAFGKPNALLQSLQLRMKSSPARDHPGKNFPSRSTIPSSASLQLWLRVAQAVALIAFCIGAFLQTREFWKAYLLKTEGVVTTAQVVNLVEEEDSEGGSQLYLYYSFTTRPQDGSVQSPVIRERVPYSVYASYSVGDPLEIIYARSVPSWTRRTSNFVPGAVNFWPLIASISIVLISWGVSCLLDRYLRDARKLDEEGLFTVVTVTDKYEESDSEGGTTYHVAYTLPGVGPTRHTVSAQRFRSIAVGSQVRVRYLPSDPKIFRLD